MSESKKSTYECPSPGCITRAKRPEGCQKHWQANTIANLQDKLEELELELKIARAENEELQLRQPSWDDLQLFIDEHLQKVVPEIVGRSIAASGFVQAQPRPKRALPVPERVGKHRRTPSIAVQSPPVNSPR